MPASVLRAHILAFVFLSPALAAPPAAVYLDAWGGVSLTEYGYPLPPPPVSAGGGNLTQPRAAQAPNGDTYMVVLDQWGSLWGNVFRAETRSWHGWRQSGGGLVGSPAIAVDANNTAWVVVRSTYNALWLTSLAPTGFSGSWTSLGGIVNGDPAIAAPSAGVAYIVARDGTGDTGAVWLVRASNGASLGWSFLGGVILGNPALVAGLNGTAHVIARDPSNYPWVAIIKGTTATWKGIATAIDSPPAGIHVNDVVTVVAIRSGQVWSADFAVATQIWGPWEPLGQAATSASPASLDTTLLVAARSPAGQLLWYRAGVGWSDYGSGFAGGALSAGPAGTTTPILSCTPSCPPGISPTAVELNLSAVAIDEYNTPNSGQLINGCEQLPPSGGNRGSLLLHVGRRVLQHAV